MFAQTSVPGKTDPDKVVLTIGDEKITAAEYDELVKSMPPQYQQYAKGAGKRAFAEQIIQLKLLSADAEKQKLDQDPKVKANSCSAGKMSWRRHVPEHPGQRSKSTTPPYRSTTMRTGTTMRCVKARHILIRVKGAPMPAVPGQTRTDRRRSAGESQGNPGPRGWRRRFRDGGQG